MVLVIWTMCTYGLQIYRFLTTWGIDLGRPLDGYWQKSIVDQLAIDSTFFCKHARAVQNVIAFHTTNRNVHLYGKKIEVTLSSVAHRRPHGDNNHHVAYTQTNMTGSPAIRYDCHLINII